MTEDHTPINRAENHTPINEPENHTPINGPENHTPINGPENHTSIKMVTATEFAVLSLEEKREVLRRVDDQKFRQQLFSSLSSEEKKILKDDLKKSIAKMMVYWVAHSRHDLQADLLGGTPGEAWKGLAIKEAFKNDDEWKEFFIKASNLFKETNVLMGAQRISQRVHGGDGSVEDWLSELDPLCPSDPTLNVMYQAAATFVDNNNWSG